MRRGMVVAAPPNRSLVNIRSSVYIMAYAKIVYIISSVYIKTRLHNPVTLFT